MKTRSPLVFVIVIVAAAVVAGALILGNGGTEGLDRRTGAGLPRRIICMAPNVTETVFALGGGDRVVGVDEFSSYPVEAKDKPHVGGLLNPDLEKIISLSPDLVIVQDKHEKVEQLCLERNIAVLRVNMVNVQNIHEGIRIIGAELGLSAKARALNAQLDERLKEVAKRVEGAPKVKVFFCTGRKPGTLTELGTVGGPSFLNEMIKIAGGENIFADSGEYFPQVPVEAVVQHAPDVIIETRPGETVPDKRGVIREWDALSTVPAIQREHVYLLTDDYILTPGPRVALIADRLATFLHVRDVK